MELNPKIIKQDLVYPELSYKLVGYAFDVFKELGFGHREDVYQKAYAQVLKKNRHNFTEQEYYPIRFQGVLIKKNFADFKVDDSVIVELKKDRQLNKEDMEQVNQYLKASSLKSALLFNFTRQGVVYKRLVNIK